MRFQKRGTTIVAAPLQPSGALSVFALAKGNGEVSPARQCVADVGAILRTG